MQIATNEIKSGERVRLESGWWATIMDNRKGNARLAKVEGLYTETGSVIYAHDIVYRLNSDGTKDTVVLTAEQKELKDTIESLW